MKKYNGWILSNSIVKRSVAIFGHYLLGYIIVVCTIAIPVGLIAGLIALLTK